jgi:hypothetical protein
LPIGRRDFQVGQVQEALQEVTMSRRRHLTLVASKSCDGDHRVVGRRHGREPTHGCGPDISSALSLAKYERDQHEDDYRHRMMLNGLAFAVTIALIASGVWLAANIHE